MTLESIYTQGLKWSVWKTFGPHWYLPKPKLVKFTPKKKLMGKRTDEKDAGKGLTVLSGHSLWAPPIYQKFEFQK